MWTEKVLEVGSYQAPKTFLACSSSKSIFGITNWKFEQLCYIFLFNNIKKVSSKSNVKGRNWEFVQKGLIILSSFPIVELLIKSKEDGFYFVN